MHWQEFIIRKYYASYVDYLRIIDHTLIIYTHELYPHMNYIILRSRILSNVDDIILCYPGATRWVE